MKIIIAGAGDVGFHLSKLLSGEFHDIIVIDKDEDILRKLEAYNDVISIKGSATSIQVLKEANIKNTDLLIAVTSSEDANFTICALGKQLGAKRTIARISNHEFLDDDKSINFNSMGINHLIYPEELATEEICKLIKLSAFSESHDFVDGKLKLLGIVFEQGSPAIGKSIMELANANPDINYTAVAIHREDTTIIPRGTTVFEENDHVYFITPPDQKSSILKLAGKCEVNVSNLMVLGGSKMGKMTAEMLQNNCKVKLIEKDKDRGFELADYLDKTMVLHGDGGDLDFLEEEGIQEMDAFVAVTGNSEVNIISCLIAKKQGVKKTIAVVNNIDYINLSQTMGIDTLVNKKLSAASSILKYIRKGDITNITSLPSADAEVVEFKVKAGSKITKSPIKDLKFPNQAIIGGILRDGDSFIANGNTHIQADDHVVVFSLPDGISKIEQFFK